MKQLLLFLAIGFSFISIHAQEVPKQILLEHFTNTYCSVCASKNPSFYSTISSFNEVVHVAYHPSSPYPACPLNQHNPTANDARTNYYNIYGSTPKVVMNGILVPANSNLINASSLNMEKLKTSPFSIDIQQSAVGSDSLYAIVNISTVASTSVNTANILVLLSEKELELNAVNGENVHYDVFRKFLEQETITLPPNGSTVSFTYGSRFDQDWTPAELTTTVILQEANQNVLQSAQSQKLEVTTGISSMSQIEQAIYPNPAKNYLTINNSSQLLEKVEIYNIIGSLLTVVDMKDKQQTQLAISDFERGNYILRIYDKSKHVFTRKFVFSD